MKIKHHGLAAKAARRQALMLALLVAAASLLLRSPAVAQVPGLFEVLDVSVDETAESAQTARDRALAAGERKAFDILIERVTRAEDRDRLKSVTPSEISALIKDFWVSQEKLSAVRYIATLNFTFSRERVRGLLGRRGVAIASQPSRPVLIVPVYVDPQAGPQLWQEGNPWRGAWSEQKGTSLVPVRTIDRGDPALLSVEQAMTHDARALAALAESREAGQSVVAIAEPITGAAADRLELRVRLNRIDAEGRLATTETIYRPKPGEDYAQLLKRAARESVLTLDAAWKGQTRVQPQPTAAAAVDVPVSDLGQWLAVRRRLRGIDAVDGVNIVLFSRDRVRINLVYSTTPQDLVNVLASAGLHLSLDPGTWTLAAGGRPSAQPAP